MQFVQCVWEFGFGCFAVKVKQGCCGQLGLALSGAWILSHCYPCRCVAAVALLSVCVPASCTPLPVFLPPRRGRHIANLLILWALFLV